MPFLVDMLVPWRVNQMNFLIFAFDVLNLLIVPSRGNTIFTDCSNPIDVPIAVGENALLYPLFVIC